MPKISVIMPAYNAEKYIAEAMDSILNQTFRDFEFIILNDCSKDRTEEIILSYDDPRIVYVKNEENMGVARTLNRGLDMAKGEYIARMDADDISLPERFEKQVAYLDANADIAVLGTNIELFTDKKSLGFREFSHNPELMALDMFFSCGVAHPSVMMRTNVIQNLGGYAPEFNGLEDYELWCRVLEHYNITTLPDILLQYRIHGNQVTKNPSPRHQELQQQLKIRQIQQLGMDSDNAEAFFLFCKGEKPNTAEKIAELDAFFTLADEANTKIQFYNTDKLRATFCTVILSSAVAIPKTEQKQLVSKCRFLTKRDLFSHSLKFNIKKLLGRN